jgi:ubiquinone/menaquinone biosynthesis C-methylase UbiE
MPYNLFESLAYTISAKSRQKKYAQFLAYIKPTKDATILDVGVNTQEYSATDNFLEKQYPYPENITAVATSNLESFKLHYPLIHNIQADGRSLPFEDNSFDVSYSNAVIEHVGNKDDQVHFLRELFRVSHQAFMTTPNRLFPIEIHTRLPFLHLILSRKNFHKFLSYIGKGWATGDYMHLLSEKELRAILQKANIVKYTLIKNRFFFFTMTFTIIWKKH